MTIAASYRKHESTKKRECAQCVRDVEHGVFTPLVLSTTGGMGREAVTFYKRLWQMESPGRNKKHTRSTWGGINAISSLQSSIPPSYASVEADPLDTTVCEWNIALATSEGRVPSAVH